MEKDDDYLTDPNEWFLIDPYPEGNHGPECKCDWCQYVALCFAKMTYAPSK